MIDRYHLRYFLSVIDTGNFSRAAAACNVSQPTLSVGIAKLEHKLGRPLFRRDNRRVELTEAGVRLAAHARSIESGFAQAEREVAGTATVVKIRLGVLGSTPRLWIETFLRHHRDSGGDEQIEIIEGRERELNEGLARGRIDLALTIIRPGYGRHAHDHLLTEGYALALPNAHPLAGRPSIAAPELVNDPMIVRRHCEILSETSRFFTSHGVRPFFSARTVNDDLALGYVRGGLGITVMPDGFKDPAIVRPRLDGFDLTRDIGLVYGPHVDATLMRASSVVAALTGALEEVRTP